MNVWLMIHQNLRKTSEERRLKEEQSSNRHWVISKRVWAVNRVREPCWKWTFVVYISLFIHIYSFVFGISTQLYCIIAYQFLLLKNSHKKKIKWGGKCGFKCRKSLQNSYIQLVSALSFCEGENIFLPHQTICNTYFLTKFVVKYFTNVHVYCLVWQNQFLSLSYPEYIVCCIVKFTNGFCIDEEYQAQETSHRTNSDC